MSIRGKKVHPLRKPTNRGLEISRLNRMQTKLTVEKNEDEYKKNLFGHFKNKSIENEFMKFYYSFTNDENKGLLTYVLLNFFRVKACLALGIILWCIFIPIDISSSHKVVGDGIWILNIVLRVFVIPIAILTLIYLCLKISTKHPIYTEIIGLGTLLCFSVTLCIKAASANKNTQGYPVGTILFTFLTMTLPKPRTHLVVLLGVVTSVCYIVSHFSFNYDVLFYTKDQWNTETLQYIYEPVGYCNETIEEFCFSQAVKQREIPVFMFGILAAQILGVFYVYLMEHSSRNLFIYQQNLKSRNVDLKDQLNRQMELLQNILPKQYVVKVKNDNLRFVKKYSCLAIVTSDIVDFTEFCSDISAEKVVSILNAHYAEFDRLSEVYDLEKIKTIGDSYFTVGGLQGNQINPSGKELELLFFKSIEMGRAMIQSVIQINSMRKENLSIRVGISCGETIVGVLGKEKITCDAWGKSVALSKEMESTGVSDKVQICDFIYKTISSFYLCRENGISKVDECGGKKYIIEDVFINRLEEKLKKIALLNNKKSKVMIEGSKILTNGLLYKLEEEKDKENEEKMVEKDEQINEEKVTDNTLMSSELEDFENENTDFIENMEYVFVEKVRTNLYHKEVLKEIKNNAFNSKSVHSTEIIRNINSGSFVEYESCVSNDIGSEKNIQGNGIDIKGIWKILRIFPKFKVNIDYLIRSFEQEVFSFLFILFAFIVGDVFLTISMGIILLEDTFTSISFIIFYISITFRFIVFVCYFWIILFSAPGNLIRIFKNLTYKKVYEIRNSLVSISGIVVIFSNYLCSFLNSFGILFNEKLTTQFMSLMGMWCMFVISLVKFTPLTIRFFLGGCFSVCFISLGLFLYINAHETSSLILSIALILCSFFYAMTYSYLCVSNSQDSYTLQKKIEGKMVCLIRENLRNRNLLLSVLPMGIIQRLSTLTQKLNQEKENLVSGEFNITENLKERVKELQSKMKESANSSNKPLKLSGGEESFQMMMDSPRGRNREERKERQELFCLVADKIKSGSVLFVSLEGFEDECLKYHNESYAFTALNIMFNKMDELTDDHKRCHKIKSTGSCYIVVSGINDIGEKDEIEDVENAHELASLALLIKSALLDLIKNELKKLKANWGVKLGLNSGDFVAGVLGYSKFLYDVFGDPINCASRLCTTGVKNEIIFCEGLTKTFIEKKTNNEFLFEERGTVHLKGKGRVNTFFLREITTKVT